MTGARASSRQCKPRQKLNCGALPIRVGYDGTWFFRDSPVLRKEMVCMFSSMLVHRADGTYWLVSPTEEGQIQVDDVPFLAVELFTWGAGRKTRLSFRTNVDRIVSLDEHNGLRANLDNGGPPVYLALSDDMEARLTRAVYYELVALAVEEKIGEERLLGVWSNELFFPLARMDELH